MRIAFNVDAEYDLLVSKVHRWGEVIRYGGNLTISDVTNDVNNILRVIEDNRDDILGKIFSKKDYEKYISYEIDAVDICILSLVIGIDFNFSGEELNLLGIAALLKDLGMNRIDRGIFDKEGALTEEEFAQIKRHPEFTLDILNENGFDPRVGEIIVDHHERWDGKGYPRSKRGDEIHPMARIISVVDGFNAMKEERPYRKSMEGYDAVKGIIQESGKRYDPEVLKKVIRTLGVYPVGTFVALNDASICRVKSVNKETPLKPVIEIVVNSDGKPATGRVIIDVADDSKYFVVRSVSL